MRRDARPRAPRAASTCGDPTDRPASLPKMGYVVTIPVAQSEESEDRSPVTKINKLKPGNGHETCQQRSILRQTGWSATRLIRWRATRPPWRPPTNPSYLTYGTAFVGGIDIATNAQGVVTQIEETAQGRFPPGAADDLSQPGRNLLIFIHGFDNTFSDALTRGAFNREWLAASGVAAADTTVIAFSWPSLGQVAAFPVPQADYISDQNMARQSGAALMFFFQTLQPIPARRPRLPPVRHTACPQHGKPRAAGGRRKLVPAWRREHRPVSIGSSLQPGTRPSTVSINRTSRG